jgi:hypothetical protein
MWTAIPIEMHGVTRTANSTAIDAKMEISVSFVASDRVVRSNIRCDHCSLHPGVLLH